MFLSRRATICLLILGCLVAAAFLSDLAPDPTTPSTGKYRSSMSQLKPGSSSGSYASSNSPPSPGSTAPPASQPARVLSWVKDAAARISDSLPAAPSLSAPSSQSGKPIMPKMGNETLRAALGHSSWHLIHTMGNTYPLKPTRDEQAAMLSFLQLLGRLYPCGDCATHFQQMLAVHPPEPHLGTRDDLAQYLCKLHNKVNLRLGHKIFDCNMVGDRWKCGCAGTEDENGGGGKNKNKNKNKKAKPVSDAGDDQALRPDLPAAALNGKFTAAGAAGRPDVPPLAGADGDDDNVDEPADEVDEDEQRMLAAMSPVERKMRVEFRSMFPEDYAEALKRAQEVPPRYPAPPREPGWVMDVHGELVKETAALGAEAEGNKKEEGGDEDLKAKDPRVKVVAEDAAA